jgi:hypothetical protein
MKPESLLQVLGVGLRAAEVILARRAAPAAKEAVETRVDKVVARVAPAARRVLERAAKTSKVSETFEVGAKKRRRRRRSALGLAVPIFLGAATAGAAAYIVRQQQRRIRERYRPVRPAFPLALLDVLAAPGGGGRLQYDGTRLQDPATGAAYALIDGIPDFLGPAAGAEGHEEENSWAQDLVRPVSMRLLGRNSTGNAAFASAAASAAGDGWALSAPAGRGTYELEMAAANPRARILCVSNDWDALLEIRRRALAAGLTNLHYAHGLARLLPVQDDCFGGIWTAGGLDKSRAPERELTQLVRAARPGALVAGVSLVRGAARPYEILLGFAARRLPGIRGSAAHLALLQAAGLGDVRLFRDGGFVRFTGASVR